ncbi:hypothetical protein [Actinokineospora diospyrosa]|uniref:Uncharacterized protein n=1 Tax=Actinokineospora diospyrosa TaxID=103728 RepID=A0ABT1IIF3_9PSEU|nr:hypothetical protein [Actinokineospora diospyrosa]MCP2272426.1 hypothetical protein [Actinokineospora diospyrosa]
MAPSDGQANAPDSVNNPEDPAAYDFDVVDYDDDDRADIDDGDSVNCPDDSDGSEVEPGKHRACGTRARRVRGVGAHSRTSAARAADDTDVLPVVGATVRVDRPATGLAKFDLGSIPASVTPPRSWRHAAWFAVTSAMLVVLGLTYAAVTLMTGPRRPDVVEALPGLPSQFPRPMTDAPSGLTATPDRSQSAVPSTTTAGSPTPGSAAPPPEPPPAPPSSPGSAAIGPSTTDSGPGAFFEPEQPTGAAKRSTVVTPMLVVPANDPDTMGDRTEAYYRDVVADPDAAFAMTSGQLRRQGQEQIQRRYAGVTRVQVERIVIDPTRARTRSVLRVFREDGSVSTEQRELTFSYGDDPLITADKTAA